MKKSLEYWAKLRRQFMGEDYPSKGAYSEERVHNPEAFKNIERREILNEKGPT